MSPALLRIGTRGSALARWQADHVGRQLEDRGFRVEMLLIKTTGDVSPQPLTTMASVGVFTKEIQRALQSHEIDLAVHSLKDLPTAEVPGLQLAAVLPRESVHDVLVSRDGSGLDQLSAGARIGTGSLRRRAELLHRRPDLVVVDIRGNVDTRLAKVQSGDVDAVILAEAGLRRLGWSDRISQKLPLDVMLPAVGQGALGIEARTDDTGPRHAAGQLNDPDTWAAVRAERSLLAWLRAGCLAPVAAFGQAQGDQLTLSAAVLSGNGQDRIAETQWGPAAEPEALGRQVAQTLLDRGAGQLIQAAHRELGLGEPAPE